MLTLILTIINLSCFAPSLTEDQRNPHLYYIFECQKIEIDKYLLVLKIMDCISGIETGHDDSLIGGSGEVGRFQIMPATFIILSKKYYDMVLDNTPLNRFKIAFRRVLELTDNYTPEQIASIWNCGRPEWEGKRGINKHGVRYDVPMYVRKFNKQFSKPENRGK
jgi:hypothetical protein